VTAARRDRGEATTQLVVLTPVLILLVFLGVQAAIYFHAANVAAAADSQGAAAGAPLGAGPDAAVAAAQQTVADLDGASVGAPSVSAGGGFVEVTVEVAVPRIVPFFPTSVRRTSIEPIERFVPESDR
jgi:Flp pilus assembly protein TadG